MALIGLTAYGQASVMSGQVNYNGSAVPFAPIRVCSITSTGTPCVPTVNIYSDYALSHLITPNPTAADQYGNFNIFGPSLPSPNFYLVQITPSPGITWSYVYPGPSLSASGGTITGSLLITGNLTVNGTTTSGLFNATTSPYYEVNGTQIACANLSDCANLAKLNTANTFTGSPQTAPIFNAGTQFNVAGSQIAAANLANGTTGSGAIVLATSPTFVTPNIGAATGTSLALTGAASGTVFNPSTGFEIGSLAPLNHVLVGNGTNYVDSATIPPSAISGSLFYQTAAANGTAQTQRPTLNFSSKFSLTDNTFPAETTVDFTGTGSGADVVTATSAGTSGHCMQWATGNAGDAGSPCAPEATGVIASTGYVGIPTAGGTVYFVWVNTSTLATNTPVPITLPLTFAHACLAAWLGDSGPRVTAGNVSPTGAQCTSTSVVTVNMQSSGETGSVLVIGW